MSETSGSGSPDSLNVDEYEALRYAAAWVDSRPAEWLRLGGADRLRFANGLVTCDLRALVPGRGEYGFFTDPKGKILADAAFLASLSELWIELPGATGRQVAGHMGRFVVADQVEIEELEDWSTMFVAGPKAGEILTRVFQEFVASAPWHGAVLATRAGPLVVRGDRRLGVSAWALAGSAESVSSAAERLREAGVRRAGAAAVAALRIEHGVPWFGFEYGAPAGGAGDFPQETGIEDWAVSFEKGCYLGQEVVARIHFRGKVNRSLRGIVFGAGSEPRAGIELNWRDEVVAVVNSVSHSPAMGTAIGLAIVHRKVEPGAELSSKAGACRLVELPFG